MDVCVCVVWECVRRLDGGGDTLPEVSGWCRAGEAACLHVRVYACICLIYAPQ